MIRAAMLVGLYVAGTGRADELPPAKAKVCVVEPKATTKAVYGWVCQAYCAPRCRLLDWFCGGCGCCELRTRSVLRKKTVPGCPVPACVLKEVPVTSAPPVVAPPK
jgi:hypothetical protein